MSCTKKELSKIGITSNDYYIDFISQTKIYDYEKKGKLKEEEVSQYQSGFEMKKNIVIKVSDLTKVEKIIAMASKYNIYNIANVDYLNNNVNQIYDNLFDLALDIITNKKNKFIKGLGVKLEQVPPTIYERFDIILPKQLYREFTPFESSDYSSYSKKEVRKDKSMYYASLTPYAFDKIIDEASPKIGIEYIITMEATYKIKK